MVYFFEVWTVQLSILINFVNFIIFLVLNILKRQLNEHKNGDHQNFQNDYKMVILKFYKKLK